MLDHLPKPFQQGAILAALTLVSSLIVADGALPSFYTNLYLIPIFFAACFSSLAWATAVAILAGVGSSPFMTLFGVEMHSAIRPVLWLGWPAVYLFFAVTLNQWLHLRRQQQELQEVEETLQVSEVRNLRREEELMTLSAVHDAILRGEDENKILEEMIRQAADLTQAKICSVIVPAGNDREYPLVSHGFERVDYVHLFPKGVPFGEGVSGWAMSHRRVAWSPNVFQDARYDTLRLLAREVGFTSAAAAPIEFDDDLFGALVIAYAEEREFDTDELARLERLARQAALAIRSTRQRENLSRFAYETAIALTEAIESRDPYTGDHCHRLSSFAIALAQRLSLSPRELEIIGLGAALHDVGKIVVPDAILMKPGKLTPTEFAVVKQHCYSGGQICKRVPFLHEAYPIVYHHHERFDGKGYPDALKGDAIPLGARIVAVVDAYDAMTSDRPYRQALPLDRVHSILADGARKQWDPDLVTALLDMMATNSLDDRHHAIPSSVASA